MNNKIKGSLVLGIICLISGSVCSYFQYYLFAEFLDSIQGAPLFNEIVLGIGLSIISGGLMLGAKYMILLYLGNYEVNLKNEVARFITQGKLRSFTEKTAIYDLTTRGIQRISGEVNWFISVFLIGFLQGFIAVIFTLMLHWWLVVIFTAGMILLSFLSYKVEKRRRSIEKEYLDVLSKHQYHFQLTYRDDYSVLSETYREFAGRCLTDEIEVVAKIAKRLKRWEVFSFFVRNQGEMFYLYVYFILGGWLIITGRLTVGELFAFNVYGMSIKTMISLVMEWWGHYQAYSLEKTKHEKVCKAENQLLQNAELQLPEGSDRWVLSVNNISVNDLEGRALLKNISFDIQCGEVVGIVGSNGSGKTTLCNVLGGLLEEENGEIRMITEQGAVIDRMTQIQIIPQKSLFFNKTILKNIQYGSSLEERESRETLELLLPCEDMDRMDLNRMLEKGENNISGGEGKWLSLIRGMAGRRGVLICDELLDELDKKRKEEAMRLLLAVSQTVIIITHDKEIAEKLDKIIYMRDGSIDGCGTHEALKKTNKNYANFWQAT